MPKLGLGSSVGKKTLTTPGVISAGRTIWRPFDSRNEAPNSLTSITPTVVGGAGGDLSWNVISNTSGVVNVAGDQSWLYWSSAVPTTAAKYILSYTLNANGSLIQLSGGSSAFSDHHSTDFLPRTNGTHQVTVTSNGSQTGLLISAGSSFAGTISNVSLRRIESYTGQALEFDGVSDYISLPSDFMTGATAISISLWFNTTQADSGMISKYYSSSVYNWWINVKSGKLTGNINANRVETSDLTSTIDVNDGNWHQAVLTWSYSSGLASLYLDGVLIDTDANTNQTTLRSSSIGNTIGFQGYISSGTLYEQGGGIHQGLLSNVQIWDTVLTASDVAYAYANSEKLALDNSGTSLTYSDLKLWYPMQDGHRGQQSYLLDGANTGLSNELWDDDYSSSTGSWIAYSTNEIDYEDNAIKITGDGSNANGAYVNFSEVKATTENLVVGALYELTCKAKVNSGKTVNLHINNLGANAVIVTNTDFEEFTFHFIAASASGDYFRTQSLGDGDIIHIKDISVKSINAKNHGTSTFHGDEILSNTGFETLKSGESGNTAGTVTDLFDNWTVALGGSSTVEADTDVSPQAGTYACKMTYNGGQSYIYQDATVVSGRNYTLTFYVRGDGSKSGHIRVHKTTGGDYIAEADIGQTAASWSQKTYTFTADANGDVRIRLLTDTATSSVWFDEVSFKETGFATGWTNADAQPTIPQLGFQSYNQLGWLDGVAGYVSMGSPSTLDNMNDGGGTFSAWIFANGLGETAYPYVFWKNDKHKIRLSNESGGAVKVHFHYKWDGDDGSWYTDDRVINFGKWHHLAITYDADSASNNPLIFVDGVSVSITDSTPSGTREDDASSNFIIGGDGGGGDSFEGVITEISVFDKELSIAEVQELYNYGEALDALTHSSKTNLTGYWRNKGNAAWTDLSIDGNGDSNGNHGDPQSITENLILPEGNNGRDTQGFLMTRERVSGLNLPYKNSGGQRVSYVDIGASTISSGTDFTIGFWAKPIASYNALNIMGASGNDYMYFSATGNDVRLYIRANGNSAYEEFDSDDVHNTNDLEKWQYWTITRGELASNQLRFYLNGRINNTGANITTHAFAHDMDLRYLANITSSSTPFRGVLDDVVIYNSTALTPAQVLRNYKAGKRRHKN